MNLGVNVAVFHNNHIVLTKREDFEVWCLPGGEVDPGESLGQAACREAWEELGLRVRLEHLVGFYSRPAWRGAGAYVAVFRAVPETGEFDFSPDPHEVLEVGYFSRSALPEEILVGHTQRILDAFDGLAGVVRIQDYHWPFPATLARQEIYAMRDASGLGRQGFYMKMIANQPGADSIEVPGWQIEQPVADSSQNA